MTEMDIKSVIINFAFSIVFGIFAVLSVKGIAGNHWTALFDAFVCGWMAAFGLAIITRANG